MQESPGLCLSIAPNEGVGQQQVHIHIAWIDLLQVPIAAAVAAAAAVVVVVAAAAVAATAAILASREGTPSDGCCVQSGLNLR